MRTTSVKRGFTLIELLVVIAIIAVLAAILFPVFGKAKAKARQVNCLSNTKQLALAMIMFTEDNKQYPDAATWVDDLTEYTGNPKLFTCPSDDNGAGYVSYAMSGLLVGADGKGISVGAMKNPVDVGLVVDATSKKYPNGGVLGYAGTEGDGIEVESRHSYNIAYADGHAESFGAKNPIDIDDPNSAIGMGFYQAVGFGWVVNSGAGVPVAANAVSGSFSIRGSTTWAPIWDAAIAGWVAGGGDAPDIYLTGSSDAPLGNIGGSSSASGLPAPSTILATDAMGMIYKASGTVPTTALTRNQIKSAFTHGMMPGSVVVNIYSRDVISGTRKDWEKDVLKNSAWVDYTPSTPNEAAVEAAAIIGKQKVDGCKVTFVTSQSDMIKKVYADRNSVGYMGAGVADPNKFAVAKIKLADGTVQTYNRLAVKSGQTGENGWFLQRPLTCKKYIADGTSPAADAFFTYVTGEFKNSAVVLKSEFFPAPAGGLTSMGGSAF